ncbi:MAG: signal peptidase I [Methanosphaera sp.]|nr:signal peptidase I [Methanosphaera sp.]
MSKKRKNRQKKKKQKEQEEKKKNKNNKTYIAKEIISYALIIVIAVLVSSHLNVVVSGSMEPAFYRGDIVVTMNTETFYGVSEFDPYTNVEVGDVVVYDATWYSEPVVHRVIDIQEINGSTYYIIKGDNNEVQDPEPVSPSQVTAKVATIGGHLLVIPKIGYITLMFRGL